MITVNLTNEQYMVVLGLLEADRTAHMYARAGAAWPDADFHAATVTRLDSTIAAMRAGLAHAVEQTCNDCGCTGQPHYFINTGAETLCVDCA